MPVTQHVGIPGAQLTLEGQLTWPDGLALASAAICHPHPLYGGEMRNNVVLAIERALLRHGVACLRFNFRGVGRSGGDYTGGPGEREDARAALAYLRKQPGLGDLPQGLAGFSFGGNIALQAAVDEPALAFLILVAPAAREPMPGVERITAPKLVLGGSRDPLVRPEVLQELYVKLADPKEIAIIEHADHFWYGRERLLEQAIERFLGTVGV